ncbi:23S rRNA (uracil(1939)-C(5))-methyltransferase RlmD [Lacticaseibacillus sp. GG6-2]
MEEITIGQRFPLTIKRLDINGNGIGYYKRKITFVVGALPGEVVVAEVTAIHDRYLEAKCHRVKQPSPHRITPIDPHWGQVGGVELGHLDYGQQLVFKRDVVSQALAKYKPAGWQHYDVRATIGAKNPLHYRNKAQFPVRIQNGHVVAGLYAPNSHRLVPLTDFATQKPLTMTIINKLCALLEKLNVPIYDEAAHSGIVKTLVVRESTRGEVQVTFVTNSKKLPHHTQLLAAIAQDMPEVVSISQNINLGETSLVWGPETKLLAGSPYLTETIRGREFRLSPQAFLQLNPEQTERLYQLAIDALALQPHETLVDAYAGVGTIGLALADQARRVRGMETIPEAVADANANAELNHITNAQYEVGKAEDLFPKWLQDGFKPDAVIVDPPRAGLDTQFIHALHQAKPKRFVYISCNPSTLARDLVALSRDWRVDYIQSIDMFPQTARCEAVVKFTRR